jgi:plastocyanin
MRKWVIGILVVALVAAGTWVLLNRDSATAPTAPPTESQTTTETDDEKAETTEVAYQTGGFSPAELRVKVGTKVTFRNDSQQQLWIATDPHPAHTEYPEFNSERGIGPGQTYSFTFTRAGNWGYHNNLNSFHTGTIIVEE